jgi:aryl-alcohol dehydrogenase-like predicted oxidoreductase
MMQLKQLGKNGPHVSSLGLGCMGMSGLYGDGLVESESIATIHAALADGITLLDTGDFYGMGHNELLIRKALAGKDRSGAVISVKFGPMRDPAGGWGGFDARPNAVKNFLAYSLKRLGTDYIDIYRPARLDPTVPIEETIGAIADMVGAGYVRYIGLSEVGSETIRRAHAVHPIADLQIEYSLMSRGLEATILPALRELGIGVTAYSVLARGLLSGRTPATGAKNDIRTTRMPRFSPENLEQNLQLAGALHEIADEKHVTNVQLAIAWVGAQGNDIVPLFGARRPGHVADAVGAATLDLAPDDLRRIGAAVPPERVAGTRYSAANMADLDSERG